MPIYAIGDVQGCFDELLELLNLIGFNERHDQLWFTGDLVNRGPKSLNVIRLVKNLKDSAVTVLGNHDLHLLALAHGVERYKSKDTVDDVLTAIDKNELLDWLKQRPLMHYDSQIGFILIHAGLPPQWDIEKAESCAFEVEEILRSNDAGEFFKHIYGDMPERWSKDLTEWDRIRFIVNCFSRLRYCDSEGRILMEYKGAPGKQPAPYLPWFDVPGRKSAGTNIVFGHWATLGFYRNNDIYALDTGCVWGGSLTALRLDDGKRYSIQCQKKQERGSM